MMGCGLSKNDSKCDWCFSIHQLIHSIQLQIIASNFSYIELPQIFSDLIVSHYIFSDKINPIFKKITININLPLHFIQVFWYNYLQLLLVTQFQSRTNTTSTEDVLATLKKLLFVKQFGHILIFLLALLDRVTSPLPKSDMLK